MTSAGNPRATWSVAAGLASTLTLPVAVFATRYSESYDLLHAGFAIPVGIALGVIALRLARAARHRSEATLGRAGGLGAARVGHGLGLAGLWLAGAALVAVAVYGLLEYIGSAD